MKTQIYQMDAFPGSPFRGNPAAARVMEEFPSEVRMSADDAEKDLSGTAFVLPERDGYRLCRFTPNEVERNARRVFRRVAEIFALGVILSGDCILLRGRAVTGLRGEILSQ